SLDLSRLATTLNRLERSIQTGINMWYQSLVALDLGYQAIAKASLILWEEGEPLISDDLVTEESVANSLGEESSDL
ncbi:hypothetical protein Tco_1159524, partial [Tanacetum coccineum]